MSFSGRRVSILRQALQQSPDGRRFSIHKEPTEHEKASTPHLELRSHPAHKPHAGLDTSRASTGVVWTTEQASQHGFLEDPTSWANLGQGAPEVDDDIEGSFPRPTSIDISVNGREYGPTAGIKPLREAVANLYNVQYRQGKDSQCKSPVLTTVRSGWSSEDSPGRLRSHPPSPSYLHRAATIHCGRTFSRIRTITSFENLIMLLSWTDC
jgi:hypothetical protein